MRFSFDYYHNLEKTDLYLCNPDGKELYPLPGRDRRVALRFNDISELSFVVDDKYFVNAKTMEVCDKSQFICVENIEDALLD